MQHQDLMLLAARPAAGRPAVLQLGIAHPDARIDREDGRTTRGRPQRQAIAAGRLAPRPGVRHQLVVTGRDRAPLGCAVLAGGGQ
ncbi:hypothetical protein KXR53_34540 [Inquilinus limosus]|uniref:hypothetical protein n=1 Tax=Inquilinus limosus TaxID=171674 RepID=UPI003F18F807